MGFCVSKFGRRHRRRMPTACSQPIVPASRSLWVKKETEIRAAGLIFGRVVISSVCLLRNPLLTNCYELLVKQYLVHCRQVVSDLQ